MASLFTKIIKKEIPSFCIKEDERFYAFLDIRPIAPGHTLVIPKLEIDHFYELPDEIIGCLLYTSDAAVDTPCVDLGGRRIIK